MDLISKERVEKIREIIEKSIKKTLGYFNTIENFESENIVISIYSENPEMQPRECAEKCNKKHLTNFTGNDVIAIFNNMWLRPMGLRKAVFYDAIDVAKIVLLALCGDNASMDEIENRMRENKGRIIKTKSKNFERVALFTMLELSNDIVSKDLYNKMLVINKNAARDIFYSIIDMMKLDRKMSQKEKIQFGSVQEYENEIVRLETNLNRSNMMLERLESDFEERLEECRIEENINLMSMLNSPKYGYILDLLQQAQSGVNTVKQNRTPIPFEINSVPILIRKLLQFTSDCGISPMLECGQILNVKASDIEGYSYDGTPFENDEDTKTIEVISSGWIIEEKQIIISSPRVREVEGN